MKKHGPVDCPLLQLPFFFFFFKEKDDERKDMVKYMPKST